MNRLTRGLKTFLPCGAFVAELRRNFSDFLLVENF